MYVPHVYSRPHYLTLSILGKIVSRRHTGIFSYFPRKQVSTIVQIVFHDLWNHSACGYGIFENRVLFMYTLEGVSSVANFITAYEESQ